MNNLNHCISIFTGDIPPSKALFLKLENAFLLANTHEIIEIVSQKAKRSFIFRKRKFKTTILV
ncbi:MAG TPA: hypothetical protein PLF55_04915 [Aliarcobacter cryaerophilus]|nr:hypothetical protein [Aliarcobacter cryaerophilus]